MRRYFSQVLYRFKMWFFPDFCYQFLSRIGVDKMKDIFEEAEKMRKETGAVDYEILANKHLGFLR